LAQTGVSALNSQYFVCLRPAISFYLGPTPEKQ